MFEDQEGKALLKEWVLMKKYVGIGNCILGYRDCEYPEPKPKRRICDKGLIKIPQAIGSEFINL